MFTLIFNISKSFLYKYLCSFRKNSDYYRKSQLNKLLQLDSGDIIIFQARFSEFNLLISSIKNLQISLLFREELELLQKPIADYCIVAQQQRHYIQSTVSSSCVDINMSRTRIKADSAFTIVPVTSQHLPRQYFLKTMPLFSTTELLLYNCLCIISRVTR